MLTEGSFTSILEPRVVKCDGGRASLLDTPFGELKTQEQRLQYCQLLAAFAEFVYTNPYVRSTTRVSFRSPNPEAKHKICNSIWFPLVECFALTVHKEIEEVGRRVASMGLETAGSSDFKDEEKQQQQVFIELRKRLRVLIGWCFYVKETVLEARWSLDRTSADVITYVNTQYVHLNELHAALRWLGLWCVLRSGDLQSHSRLGLLVAMVACRRKVPVSLATKIHAITRDTAETACVWEFAQELHAKMDYSSALHVGHYYERLLLFGPKPPDLATLQTHGQVIGSILTRWEKDAHSAHLMSQGDQVDTPEGSVFHWEWAQKHMPMSTALERGVPVEIDETVWRMRVPPRPGVPVMTRTS